MARWVNGHQLLSDIFRPTTPLRHGTLPFDDPSRGALAVRINICDSDCMVAVLCCRSQRNESGCWELVGNTLSVGYLVKGKRKYVFKTSVHVVICAHVQARN